MDSHVCNVREKVKKLVYKQDWEGTVFRTPRSRCCSHGTMEHQLGCVKDQWTLRTFNSVAMLGDSVRVHTKEVLTTGKIENQYI
jgi:hypothetical protein